ncbi:MAG: hypothetical protein A2538_01025 [Candidatus Magasanikbacteria bacterium RIFOXYD2_FULL_41_14]|uniref:DUF4012 domain-containing protein n=1 Tax=Candidatus Magasanikbacteria bacterium RIFOXYD2_FULL_41_14 TaxID=1798709 RepID=A0A1F6PDY1_9BACT|nr:MAG: hypothetical protein A2538_01025 [Candidatus Magasanikbacteria bacterium RIFOXYD2_FULL_41_14]
MKKIKILFFTILLMIVVVGVSGYFWLQNNPTGQALFHFGGLVVGANDNSVILKQALGLSKPKTYLLLFLNNTELRPGGGFIGAYAVVRIDKAKPEILKIEGSEILDKNATAFLDNPPEPIQRSLAVDNWFFRDSNWSPDFASSSENVLRAYAKENGLLSENIDAVVGFTPTVLEEFLKIVGPITAEGIEFNAQNFTEKLEYEVEYGYVDRGEEFVERKNLLADVATALIAKGRENILEGLSQYFAVVQRMILEKQIVFYSVDSSYQSILKSQNLSGQMTTSTGDYLFWVDANLGSLKTDVALTRDLTYKIVSTGTQYLARATMYYDHTGDYDWRTTRYLAYSRIFVPLGSRLISITGSDVEDALGKLPTDEGVENGRQWFGSYIKIIPGKSLAVTFEYLLPSDIIDFEKSKQYNLFVQKQIGTNQIGLNLNLNFGRNIRPVEPSTFEMGLDNNSNNDYNFKTDLVIDRAFVIEFDN